MPGGINVVISRQRHVAGNGNPRALQLTEYADRHRVVQTKDGVGHGSARSEELARRLRAAGHRERAAPDQGFFHGQTEPRLRPADAEDALLGIEISVRPGENRDAAMALLVE